MTVAATAHASDTTSGNNQESPESGNIKAANSEDRTMAPLTTTS